MPHCPFCQNEVDDEVIFCPHCGKQLNLIQKSITSDPKRKGLYNHIKYSITFILKNPIIILPELVATLVTWGTFRLLGESFTWFNLEDLLLSYLGIDNNPIFSVSYASSFPTVLWLLPVVLILVLVIVTGVSGLFTFLTIHMAWEKIQNRKIDIGTSLSYLKPRLGRFFLASIVANVFGLTMILIPAAIFMYAVMVVDDTGIRSGLTKGFKLSLDNIGSSVGLVLSYYIALWLVGMVPRIGTFLRFIPPLVFELAALDLFLNSIEGPQSTIGYDLGETEEEHIEALPPETKSCRKYAIGLGIVIVCVIAGAYLVMTMPEYVTFSKYDFSFNYPYSMTINEEPFEGLPIGDAGRIELSGKNKEMVLMWSTDPKNRDLDFLVQSAINGIGEFSNIDDISEVECVEVINYTVMYQKATFSLYDEILHVIVSAWFHEEQNRVYVFYYSDEVSMDLDTFFSFINSFKYS